MSSVYDFSALDIHGQTVKLEQFRGKPLLIVNTASACGFTPQFAGLQALHEAYADKGLVVLGFPATNLADKTLNRMTRLSSFASSITASISA